MPGLMQRIFRRRSSGSPRLGRSGLFRRRTGAKRAAWGKKAVPPAAPDVGAVPANAPAAAAAVAVATPGRASFRDRGKLRRRLRYLRRTRELAYRDIGGLIFDMRRFGRSRQDLLDAKVGALAAVDQELRALERALGDRRPIHELREPGISSCARCGALHDSEANFCPHCGLPLGGPRAMGGVGAAIAAPPQPPQPPPAPTAAAPAAAAASAPTTPPPPPAPAPAPAPDQPTQTLRPPSAPDGT